MTHLKLNTPGISQQLLFYVHPHSDNGVSEQIRKNQIWEPYETSLIVNTLKRGGVFLDIGANIGYYSVLASVVVGHSGKVISYEPDEDNYHLLQKNLGINHLHNVYPFMAAVSDYNGSGYIYLSNDNKGDHRIYEIDSKRKKQKIDVLTIDEHLPNQHVDMIKIDTQGSETHVMRGLQKTILKNKNHLTLLIEFWPYGLRQAGSSGRELLEIIRNIDMPLFIVDHLQHSLMPMVLEGLEEWSEKTDADPENQGFLNLLLTPKTEENTRYAAE